MSQGKQLSVLDETINYHNKLEKWTDKEMQLNTLHEEIVTKREALLRTSRNMLHDQHPEERFLNDTEAALRNDRMVKDFKTLEESLDDGIHAQKSPRFTALQANYWSMINNMYPLWERAMADEIPTKESNTKDAKSRRELQWISLSQV
ncbi:chromosome 3 open reading frame 14 [Elysia marginata]|uniref:Chromosome 3 open reading frame 14 n=1 Tax=Elysia marginata TaxID=1093978 RepID=A0AAV4FJ54_9GAST|nr:chromosome 3 open reading frame 14 [Elysia marginata]